MSREKELEKIDLLTADEVLAKLIVRLIPNAKFKILEGINDNYTRLVMENKPPFSFFEAEFPKYIEELKAAVNAFYDKEELEESVKEKVKSLLKSEFIEALAVLTGFIDSKTGEANVEALRQKILQEQKSLNLEYINALIDLLPQAETLYNDKKAQELSKKQTLSDFIEFIKKADLDNLSKSEAEQGLVLFFKFFKVGIQNDEGRN